MSWWHGADRAGHLAGPDHPDVDEALAEQDAQLGALLAGLDARTAWEHTTLLVTSDHGMTTASESVPLRERLSEAGLSPRRVDGSAVVHLFFEDPEQLERAEQALEDLPGARVERREALPAELGLAHPTRSGDLVVRALPGYSLRTRSVGSQVLRLSGRQPGLHGYAVPHPRHARHLPRPGSLRRAGRAPPGGGRPRRRRQRRLAARHRAARPLPRPRPEGPRVRSVLLIAGVRRLPAPRFAPGPRRP